MIKINLLGNETVIDHTSKYFGFAYGATFAAVLLLCALMYTSVSGRIVELEDGNQSLESNLAQLRTRTKAVSDLEKKRKVLESKLAVIYDLRKRKLGPVRVMDDLNIAVPQNAWLLNISEKSNTMKILGRALDNQTIADFMRALQDSEYFTKVDLITSRQLYLDSKTGRTSNGRSSDRRGDDNPRSSLVRIKEFQLETTVAYSGAFKKQEGEKEEKADKKKA